MGYIKCYNCGYKLSANTKHTTCPKCKTDIVNYVQNHPNKKNGCLGCIKYIFIFFAIIIVLFLLSAIINNEDSTNETVETTLNKTTTIQESTTEPITEIETTTQNNEETTLYDYEKEYDSNFEYVNKKVLYENADVYKNINIVTVVFIEDMDDNTIKAYSGEADFMYDFSFNFENKKELDDIKPDYRVCIIGTVSETDIFGVLEINNCHIIAYDDVSKYEELIKNSNSEKEAKNKNKNKNKAEKESYVNKCQEYSYDEIQRHPNKYEGKYIKTSGTVIQVSEGWFDTVTLRVEDNSGDVWYIDYLYNEKEARIIENDYINIYGECGGTETYTTVLGDSVTIPYIDAKYIDIQ